MENDFGSRDRGFTPAKPEAINQEKRIAYRPPAFRNGAISNKSVIVDGIHYERGANGAFGRVGEKRNAAPDIPTGSSKVDWLRGKNDVPIAGNILARSASVIPDKDGFIELRPGEYIKAEYAAGNSPHPVEYVGDIQLYGVQMAFSAPSTD